MPQQNIVLLKLQSAETLIHKGNKADCQHQVLIEKIQEIDPNAKVWYYPLMVGVSGSIYLSTTMYLQVSAWHQRRCIKAMHL
jgi:hypothetical protein